MVEILPIFTMRKIDAALISPVTSGVRFGWLLEAVFGIDMEELVL